MSPAHAATVANRLRRSVAALLSVSSAMSGIGCSRQPPPPVLPIVSPGHPLSADLLDSSAPKPLPNEAAGAYFVRMTRTSGIAVVCPAELLTGRTVGGDGKSQTVGSTLSNVARTTRSAEVHLGRTVVFVEGSDAPPAPRELSTWDRGMVEFQSTFTKEQVLGLARSGGFLSLQQLTAAQQKTFQSMARRGPLDLPLPTRFDPFSVSISLSRSADVRAVPPSGEALPWITSFDYTVGGKAASGKALSATGAPTGHPKAADLVLGGGRQFRLGDVVARIGSETGQSIKLAQPLKSRQVFVSQSAWRPDDLLNVLQVVFQLKRQGRGGSLRLMPFERIGSRPQPAALSIARSKAERNLTLKTYDDSTISEDLFTYGLHAPFAAFSATQQLRLQSLLEESPESTTDYAALDLSGCDISFGCHLWTGSRFGTGGFKYPANM